MIPTLSSVAKLTTSELMDGAAEAFRTLASLAGRIVLLAAELDRREGGRGPTSVPGPSTRCTQSNGDSRVTPTRSSASSAPTAG
ncbi:MAG TPA: hypothetical protein VG244_06095 [Acidimicrobiales bacterium]|nr:hypothetical protein [Acidimicrobiales bacterium]